MAGRRRAGLRKGKGRDVLIGVNRETDDFSGSGWEWRSLDRFLRRHVSAWLHTNRSSRFREMFTWMRKHMTAKGHGDDIPGKCGRLRETMVAAKVSPPQAAFIKVPKSGD